MSVPWEVFLLEEAPLIWIDFYEELIFVPQSVPLWQESPWRVFPSTGSYGDNNTETCNYSSNDNNETNNDDNTNNNVNNNNDNSDNNTMHQYLFCITDCIRMKRRKIQQISICLKH